MEWMDITTMRVNRNRTFYYLREGISSIFTHSLMSFASISIIIAILFVMGGFILLAANITAIIGDLEDDNVILAYVHENLSDRDAMALETTIRNIPNVASATFISREEALESFIGRFEDTDRYRDIDATWFRHRYSVFVDDVAYIAETQQALRYIRGIDTVNANLAIARAFVTIRNVVSWVSIIIIAVLLIISLFIISNTIKLATFERREEIAIMKMVGATNSFIRWPFIFEGFILGIVGSSIAFAIVWGLYGLAANSVMEMEMGFFRLIALTPNISVPIFLLFTAIGFSVGVGGSAMALNRYLKV